jgi:hypothetical protein
MNKTPDMRPIRTDIKHTPGPWEAVEEPSGDGDNFARSIYGPAGDFKALLIARCDQNFSHTDGRLIAAAPDLLAALRGLVAIIDKAGLLSLSNGVQLGQTAWYVKASDAIEYARAAIAKAEQS